MRRVRRVLGSPNTPFRAFLVADSTRPPPGEETNRADLLALVGRNALEGPQDLTPLGGRCLMARPTGGPEKQTDGPEKRTRSRTSPPLWGRRRSCPDAAPVLADEVNVCLVITAPNGSPRLPPGREPNKPSCCGRTEHRLRITGPSREITVYTSPQPRHRPFRAYADSGSGPTFAKFEQLRAASRLKSGGLLNCSGSIPLRGIER